MVFTYCLYYTRERFLSGWFREHSLQSGDWGVGSRQSCPRFCSRFGFKGAKVSLRDQTTRCKSHGTWRQREMADISSERSVTRGQRTGLAMLAMALVLGMSIPRASAQLTMGTVSGTVRDAQAAAVPGVTVDRKSTR